MRATSLTAAAIKALLTRSQAPSPKIIPERPEALFHSVRSALAFAYSIEQFPISSKPTLGPSVGGSGRLSSLSPHEKHAQGALIRRAAEQRLRGMDLAVTFAFYGSGQIRSAAIREVGNEVAKLVRKPGLGVELAKRQFSRNGIRRTLADLSKEFGLSVSQVQRLDKAVGDEIDRLRLSAETQLERLFVATGIAEGV